MADKLIAFDIPGPPYGKGRHRTTREGRTYTPAETESYENLVKLCCRQVYKGPPCEGPVVSAIVAIFPIPKSTSNKRAELMREGVIRPIKKPDYDNIGKVVGDALNHIAYRDDSQIVDGRIVKFYGDHPMVSVAITVEG